MSHFPDSAFKRILTTPAPAVVATEPSPQELIDGFDEWWGERDESSQARITAWDAWLESAARFISLKATQSSGAVAEPQQVELPALTESIVARLKAFRGPYLGDGVHTGIHREELLAVLAASPGATREGLNEDAARLDWLTASDWYVGPESFWADEGGGMHDCDNKNFGNLRAKIDAARGISTTQDSAAIGEAKP